MSKPFFYRITAADFLAAVVVVPEEKRGEWVLALALDMVAADEETASNEYTKSIIIEAKNFKEKKALAGRKGGNAKPSTAKAKPSTAKAKPSKRKPEAVTETETEYIYGIGENVRLTKTQHLKLKEKLNGRTEEYIDRLSTYHKINKYKNHYLTILSWWNRDEKQLEESKPKDFRQIL